MWQDLCFEKVQLLRQLQHLTQHDAHPGVLAHQEHICSLAIGQSAERSADISAVQDAELWEMMRSTP